MERGLRSWAQLFSDHVHEQPVVPNAVRVALVIAHDPDPAEAHLLVGADSGRVVDRRVDGEAVMAVLLEEVAGEQADRFGSQPPAVAGRGKKDVHVRVAIHCVVLLVVLDRADDLRVYLDDEALVRPYEPLANLLLDVDTAPPPGDLGFVSDPD